MNTKEKAIELVNKFHNHTWNAILFNFMNMEYGYGDKLSL